MKHVPLDNELPSLTLERRISAALTDDGVTATHVKELIAETEVAIMENDEAAETLRAKAFDPILSPDPKAAKQELEDAIFSANRLRTLRPRLVQRLTTVEHLASKARWDADYKALMPERDALAEELKQLYTKFAPELAAMMARVVKLDREIMRLKRTKPISFTREDHDSRVLVSTEATARGLSFIEGEHLLSLARDMVLPDFENPAVRLWPPYPNAKPDPVEQELDRKATLLQQAAEGLHNRYLFERQQAKPPPIGSNGAGQHETPYQAVEREKRLEFDRSKTQ